MRMNSARRCHLQIDRRNFLRSTGAGALSLTAMSGLKRASAQTLPGGSGGIPQLLNGSVQLSGLANLPSPSASGIDHIVVVTMENRSFDHFLGWLPGADGKQSGLSYTDRNGNSYPTWPLAPDYEGCGHPDPDHSYAPDRVAYNSGAMDGFLRAGNNDVFSIGYYTEADLPFYSALARNFLVCDRYFAAILGPTFPNRMFLWAAQTDRLDDSIGFSSLPTIFDSLSATGVSHRYYFNNLPYLALWGFRYWDSTALFSDFLNDAAAGNLPAVSFVDPTYTILDDGTGNDDHPHADIRNGDAFLVNIYQALSSSPAWSNTVLIITFDEWGGFFEHVAPPRVPAPNGLDTDQVNGQVLLGFRVPVIIVSPFTQNTGPSPLVNHTVFDHTSILKLIEWRWNLQPLTARDASPLIGNPATAMNFSAPVYAVPNLPVPQSVFAWPCFEGGIFQSSATSRLRPGTTHNPPATEWGRLSQTEHVRRWLERPKFRRSHGENVTPR